jgi:hypothetical protein
MKNFIMQKSVLGLVARYSLLVALFFVASNVSAQIVKAQPGTRTAPNDITTITYKSPSQCLVLLQTQLTATETQYANVEANNPSSPLLYDLKVRRAYLQTMIAEITAGSTVPVAINRAASSLKTEDTVTPALLSSLTQEVVALLKQ